MEKVIRPSMMVQNNVPLILRGRVVMYDGFTVYGSRDDDGNVVFPYELNDYITKSFTTLLTPFQMLTRENPDFTVINITDPADSFDESKCRKFKDFMKRDQYPSNIIVLFESQYIKAQYYQIWQDSNLCVLDVVDCFHPKFHNVLPYCVIVNPSMELKTRLFQFYGQSCGDLGLDEIGLADDEQRTAMSAELVEKVKRIIKRNLKKPLNRDKIIDDMYEKHIIARCININLVQNVYEETIREAVSADMNSLVNSMFRTLKRERRMPLGQRTEPLVIDRVISKRNEDYRYYISENLDKIKKQVVVKLTAANISDGDTIDALNTMISHIRIGVNRNVAEDIC